MRGERGRCEYLELAVLLAMLVPGGGLFFWGLRSCQEARNFGVPGAVAVLAGLCLTLAGGFYHYRRDYRNRSRPEVGATDANAGRPEGGGSKSERRDAGAGRFAFLVLTLASALIAVLAHRILLR